MELPQFPDQAQVTQNLSGWEGLCQHLSRTISDLKELDRYNQNRRRGIETVQGLFNRYVTPKYPGKTFNPSAVCVRREYCYNYNHDGVSISQIGRETWHLGDYDLFFD